LAGWPGLRSTGNNCFTEEPVRVLVCGGRSYGRVPDGCPPDQIRQYAEIAARQSFLLRETLDHIHQETPISVLIHGGAAGADAHADSWARSRSVTVEQFKANWRTHGAKAGPLRNQQMLDEGKPDMAVAFPGGKGTADAIKRIMAAGIKLVEVAKA
jgi:hypothetical protein